MSLTRRELLEKSYQRFLHLLHTLQSQGTDQSALLTV
jgi:hypothetical protein